MDQADELRRKRQRAIDRLNQLGQAIFYEMFGDLEVNNLGWETVSIRDACCEIVDCVNRTAPLSATETQFKMIRTTNVRNGRVDLTNVRFVSEETFLKWNRRLKPQSGDVLLTREAPVGGCGLIEGDDEIFLGQRLMLYRVEESKLTPEFLTYCFRSTYLEKQFDTASSGSTVKHLPLPACRAFQLRLPPIGLQKDFSARFKRLDAIRIQIEMQSIRIADLFQSLQHRAFTGTL